MPPEEWDKLLSWRFAQVPQNYWDDVANHVHAMDVVRKHIGAGEDVEKWYAVTQDLLNGMGLSGLINCKYRGSPQAFLKAIMPADEWIKLLPWKFTCVPHNYWDDASNHVRALDVVRKHIGADNDVERWYGVTKDLLRGMGLSGLLQQKYSESPKAFLKANMSIDEWSQLDELKFNFVSAQELWTLWAIQDHIEFELLGADAIDRSEVIFGPFHYRWDIVVRHIPTSRVGVLEIDGEQHFHGTLHDWEQTNRRDEMKLRMLKDHTPRCADRVDFIARISYLHRHRGQAAIADLLDLICSKHSEFICLLEDVCVYSESALPLYLDD